MADMLGEYRDKLETEIACFERAESCELREAANYLRDEIQEVYKECLQEIATLSSEDVLCIRGWFLKAAAAMYQMAAEKNPKVVEGEYMLLAADCASWARQLGQEHGKVQEILENALRDAKLAARLNRN